jgi:hypothetical protein
LTGRPPLFLIASDRAEAALVTDPYVRSIAVRAELPSSVTVKIDEWQPLAVLTRDGARYLLTDDGHVLGAAPPPGGAPGGAPGGGPGGAAGGESPPALQVSDGRKGVLRAGEMALSGRLLVDMDQIRKAAPGSYRLQIAGFELSADRELVAITTGGPRILFGQMITEEQIGTLDAKLAALSALNAQVPLQGGCLDYVNVMNPSAPTTHCPSPSPAPSANPAPKPSPSPKR